MSYIIDTYYFLALGLRYLATGAQIRSNAIIEIKNFLVRENTFK